MLSFTLPLAKVQKFTVIFVMLIVVHLLLLLLVQLSEGEFVSAQSSVCASLFSYSFIYLKLQFCFKM
jgi:hypothetical protein